MLPIYICEDDAIMREFIEEALKKYIMIQGYDMDIRMNTGDAEQLLQTVSEEGVRSVYFLDVDLQSAEWDGFRVGKEIRRRDPRGFIIYVTSHDELAFETFHYHIEVLDYISKGARKQMLESIHRCLDTVVHRMQREKGGEQQDFFTIKIADTVKHIPVADIYCFETSGRTHRIALYSEGEVTDFIGRLQEIEEQMGERFVRTHRSCLVNRDRIKAMDLKSNEVILDNGQRCPLSRKKKGVLKELIGAI